MAQREAEQELSRLQSEAGPLQKKSEQLQQQARTCWQTQPAQHVQSARQSVRPGRRELARPQSTEALCTRASSCSSRCACMGVQHTLNLLFCLERC